jgi:hypothetical protein
MLTISIWTKEDGSFYKSRIRNKHPRRYMTDWSFERLMSYIKDELEEDEVAPESVLGIDIDCKKEHWTHSVTKEDK